MMADIEKIKTKICINFPSLVIQINSLETPDIYKVVHVLADYGKQLIRERNIGEIKACFTFVKGLMKDQRGARHAIETVFVYSIDQQLQLSGTPKGIRQFFIEEFNEQYIQLINANYP